MQVSVGTWFTLLVPLHPLVRDMVAFLPHGHRALQHSTAPCCRMGTACLLILPLCH